MSLSSRANYLHVIAAGMVAGWASCATLVWADPQTVTAASSPASSTSPAIAVTATAVVTGDLSQKTDTELTELTAQWAKLSPSERRELLAEVRGRMAANREARAEARAKVGVHVQRRYGRVVRKSDGSVVVQTRVVRVRPRVDAPTSAASGRVTFGIGFEQRSKSRQATPGQLGSDPVVNPAPAVTVSQQPTVDPTE